MNRYKWQIVLGIALIAVSTALFIAQIIIFHDVRSTFFYLLQDIAFIPIQVLLVTLILNQLLNVREKVAKLNKLNMVIGAFFSEVGSGLLKCFSDFDHNAGKTRAELQVSTHWSEEHFSRVARDVAHYEFRIDYAKADLTELKAYLTGKRAFLLRLLENPNLLEHETFTELLWAVFHLTEELSVRDDVAQLIPVDGNHIGGDMKRAYALLIVEWLTYLNHLKREYPYLFSLAVRLNPFNPQASAIVKE
ncbi:MAG TPA: hypothetical protein VEI57_02840 [Nitrospirota bacterium]|nr:hypothetical protein [Nitrospirota bacterium]